MKKTLDEKFFEYHHKNPHIYYLFEKFAREIKRSGQARYSMRTIMHRVRWHIDVDTIGENQFKMNNDYSSRFARLLVRLNPEFAGFFRMRKLKTFSVLMEETIDD
jgi:hypothetical protein